jgi:hypothetical protein
VRTAASLRFLGVPAGASPRLLLGLGEGPLTPELIAQAFERQRQRVVRHPAGRDREGDRLLRELEIAAQWLTEQVTRAASVSAERGADARSSAGGAATSAPVAPLAVQKARGSAANAGRGEEARGTTAVREPVRPSVPMLELTEFDREVLAIVGAGGGWNARTRQKLMEVAARYGVSHQGMMTVVRGLGDALRRGEVRAETKPRALVQGADMTLWRNDEPSRVSVALERLDEAFAREIAGDTPARFLRLLIFFIAFGVVGIFFFYRLLSTQPNPAPATPPGLAAAPSPEELARRERPPVAPAVEVDRPGVVRPARWPKPPDLRGGPPPESVRAALRDALQSPERIANLARRLQLEASRPSAAIVREWMAAQEALAAAWPSVDATTRAAAIEASIAALRRIESDDVAKQFLDAWSVELVRADEPLGPWTAAWSAGMLAEVAARPSSPAAVAGLAIDRLDPVVPRRALLRGRGTTVFDGAAGAWLDGAARTLVTSTTTDPRAADRWERWFEAQAAVRSGAALQAAYLDAIGEVLESGLNVTETGPGSDLLGRLVAGVDWTERSPDQARVREAMTLWFSSTKIGSSRLWVLTSMLDQDYDTAWFLPEFVVDPEASGDDRLRSLERIAAAWPVATGAVVSGGIRVDSLLLERWNAAFERVTNATPTDDVDRLRIAVALARLNAVAQAFAADDVPAADGLLDEIEGELASPPELRSAPLTVGRTSGTDGEFTAAYEAAGRDPARRQDELRALRTRPLIGDLGPRDAETLVLEALKGTPNDVRDLAQAVLAERFESGPIVLQELLDQLPNAPANAATMSLLERVTRERFPEGRSLVWMRAARSALLRRILDLHPGTSHAIEALAERLGAAYGERSRFFRIGFEETVQILAPEEWTARLVGQWRMKASSLFLSEQFPASIEEIDRRHGVRMRLADGALQRCAAGQATLLEFLAMVIVAERPSLKEPVRTLLDDAIARRARVGGVLEQIIEGERAVALMQRLLFESANTPTLPSSPRQPGSPAEGPTTDPDQEMPSPGIGAFEKGKNR